MSLVAVAAVAASLLLARGLDDTTNVLPSGENLPEHLKLDAIREAGL